MIEPLLRGTPRRAECAAAILVLGVVLLGCGPAGDETPTRPNVLLVVVDTVLTGYCSPTAEKYLADNGIRVISGNKGTVAEALAQYERQGHNHWLGHKAQAKG